MRSVVLVSIAARLENPVAFIQSMQMP